MRSGKVERRNCDVHVMDSRNQSPLRGLYHGKRDLSISEEIGKGLCIEFQSPETRIGQ